MPLVVRRQPSLDLRKAARVARDAAFDYDLDSYPALQESLEQLPSSPRKGRLGRHSLRLSISSPALHHQYLSDEEQPSPLTARDMDSNSGYPEDPADSHSASVDVDADDEADVDLGHIDESAFSDTEATDLSDVEEADGEDVAAPAPQVLTAAALAIAVPILAVGRPQLVTVSSVAPPQKRQTPVDPRPAARIAGSLAIMRRFRAPMSPEITSPQVTISSPLEDNDAASFRTAASSAERYAEGLPDRVDSLTPPGHSHSDSSASESSSSSIAEPEPMTVEPIVHEEPSTHSSEVHDEDHELYYRNIVTSARQVKVSHFHQQPFELPPPPPVRRRNPRTGAATATRSSFIENFDERPTSYADYDPFALQPPTLRGDEAADTASPPASPRLRRWKGMGVGLGMGRLGRKSSRRWGFAGVNVEGVRV